MMPDEEYAIYTKAAAAPGYVVLGPDDVLMPGDECAFGPALGYGRSHRWTEVGPTDADLGLKLSLLRRHFPNDVFRRRLIDPGSVEVTLTLAQ